MVRETDSGFEWVGEGSREAVRRGRERKAQQTWRQSPAQLQTHPESHTPAWCGQSQTQNYTHSQPSRDTHRGLEAPTFTVSQLHIHRGTHRSRRYVHKSHTHTQSRNQAPTHTRQNGLMKPKSQDGADDWPVIFQRAHPSFGGAEEGWGLGRGEETARTHNTHNGDWPCRCWDPSSARGENAKQGF